MAIQYVATAQQLAAPALVSLFRSSNVHENVVAARRCQEVIARSAFVNLDHTEAGLKETAKEAFRIDVGIEMASSSQLGKEGRLQSDTKSQVDTVSHARGEPTGAQTRKHFKRNKEGTLQNTNFLLMLPRNP